MQIDDRLLVLHVYIIPHLGLGCKHSKQESAKTFGNVGAIEQLQESGFDLGVELGGFDAFFAILHMYIRDHFGLFVKSFSCFSTGRFRVDGTPVPGLKPHIERLYHPLLGT